MLARGNRIDPSQMLCKAEPLPLECPRTPIIIPIDAPMGLAATTLLFFYCPKHVRGLRCNS